MGVRRALRAIADWIKRLPIELIESIAENYALDFFLIASIIQVESRGESFAMRYEPNYKWLNHPQRWAKRVGITIATETISQQISWGLMQIMGATARDSDFSFVLSKLCQPELGIDYGCKYFLRQLDRYNGNILDAISAYNAGIASHENGSYKNQEYVDRVLSFYRGI